MNLNEGPTEYKLNLYQIKAQYHCPYSAIPYNIRLWALIFLVGLLLIFTEEEPPRCASEPIVVLRLWASVLGDEMTVESEVP